MSGKIPLGRGWPQQQVKQPSWASSSMFRHVWAAMRDSEEHTGALTTLAQSHVIRVEPEQVNALPFRAPAEIAQELIDLRLPFDATFLDLGGAVPREVAGDSYQPNDGSDLIAAAVMDAGFHEINYIGGFSVHTFVTANAPGAPVVYYGSICTRAFYDHGVATAIAAEPEQVSWESARDNLLRQGGRLEADMCFVPPDWLRRTDARTWPMVQQLAGEAAERAVSVLKLLECVGVDLAPASLSRQARRQAERKSESIPLEVHIRRGPRRRYEPKGDHRPIDYSHRFEVRGHFKHVTRGPEFNAAPEEKKVIVGGVECVRKWCPPFVKGPDDKPLIPKWRKIDDERE